MAYKFSRGERKFGDIKAQNDAEGDTLIDFDEDCIILTTGDIRRIKISGSAGDITFHESYTFPSSDGNTNQVLTTDGNGNLSFQAPATGSGANPPGGSDRQVQFNDNDTFAGDANLTFDKTTGTLHTNILSANYLYGDGSHITNTSVRTISCHGRRTST